MFLSDRSEAQTFCVRFNNLTVLSSDRVNENDAVLYALSHHKNTHEYNHCMCFISFVYIMAKIFGDIYSVPKNPKSIEINALFEFECPSTKLIPRVHERLT
jgi:hypothetical protein